jgi:hypothetical protein
MFALLTDLLTPFMASTRIQNTICSRSSSHCSKLYKLRLAELRKRLSAPSAHSFSHRLVDRQGKKQILIPFSQHHTPQYKYEHCTYCHTHLCVSIICCCAPPARIHGEVHTAQTRSRGEGVNATEYSLVLNWLSEGLTEKAAESPPPLSIFTFLWLGAREPIDC